jgi:MarR family transcriptional regulator, organic hydroperoxide resistance regulator
MSSTSGKPTNERQQLIEQLSFLGQMLSTETAHFHHTAAAKLGLSITDSKTISALMQEGPMTAGQLAERLSLTTGAVTNVIDRLEQRGIVHRVPDPKDRRKVVVHTNPKKIAECGKTYDSIGEAFAKLLSNYSLDELQFLIKYYKASIELTKQEIYKLHGGDK